MLLETPGSPRNKFRIFWYSGFNFEYAASCAAKPTSASTLAAVDTVSVTSPPSCTREPAVGFCDATLVFANGLLECCWTNATFNSRPCSQLTASVTLLPIKEGTCTGSFTTRSTLELAATC